MATTKTALTLDDLSLSRLSERQRSALLHAFDEYVPQIPSRAGSAADAEIDAVRSDRRAGGRATTSN